MLREDIHKSRANLEKYRDVSDVLLAVSKDSMKRTLLSDRHLDIFQKTFDVLKAETVQGTIGALLTLPVDRLTL